jgi:hypothetical protein
MVEILVALFLAVTVIWGVMTAAGERGGWDVWPVFLLFFFLIWGGGLWFKPVGPPVFGVYWLPFVLVALIIGLFWAAVPPPPKRPRVRTTVVDAEERDTAMTVAGLGLLFWLLLTVVSIAAFVRYVQYV